MEVSLAQYQRLYSRLAVVSDEASELIDRPVRAMNPSALRDFVERVFAHGVKDGTEAVSRVRREKAALENELNTFHELRSEALLSMDQRISELQATWQTWNTLRDGLERLLSAGLPQEWSSARQQEFAREMRSRIIELPKPDFPRDKNDLSRLGEWRDESKRRYKELKQLEHEIELNVSPQQKECWQVELEVAGAAATVQVGDVLEPERTDPMRDSLARLGLKATELLRKFAKLQNHAAWLRLRESANTIGSIKDLKLRRRKYEAFLLESDKICSALSRREKWVLEAEELVDSAAHLTDAEVDSITGRLREMIRSGREESLGTIANELAGAIRRAEERQDREQRRMVIVQSLTELGYAPQIGTMETALVEAGKLIVRKDNMQEYGVELVTDGQLSNVQAAVVRHAQGTESTAQRKLRDQEMEESWCGDLQYLQSQLATQGIKTEYRLKKEVGEVPVKVITGDEIQRRPEVPSVGKRSRTSP